MAPTVMPIEGLSLGAVVTNIDLANLDEPTWRIVEDAFIKHAALVFPGQHLAQLICSRAVWTCTEYFSIGEILGGD